MNILILHQDKKIIVNGDERICVFTLPDNITEIHIFSNKALIIYSDGTPNKRIDDVTEVLKYDELMQAYYNVKKLDPPSVYHTWNDTSKEFEVTPENQTQMDADLADLAQAQAIKDEELSSNPLSNITLVQAEAWIESNVTDLASAKVAMKKLVKLILSRT